MDRARSESLRTSVLVRSLTRWIESHQSVTPKRLEVINSDQIRIAVAYSIKQNSLFNMVLIHPDGKGTVASSWTSKGSKADFVREYASYCPRVQRLISLAPEDGVLEWSLRGHEPVPSWTRGSVALLGGECSPFSLAISLSFLLRLDACHPTLPYVGQGAAQALEDAIVISAMFSSLRTKAQIPQALRIYQASVQSNTSDSRLPPI